nr:MAG TPA: hypothetical protein [Caudoviricetes sp.]
MLSHYKNILIYLYFLRFFIYFFKDSVCICYNIFFFYFHNIITPFLFLLYHKTVI